MGNLIKMSLRVDECINFLKVLCLNGLQVAKDTNNYILFVSAFL